MARLRIIAAALAACTAFAAPASAADFYKGRTIQIMVGFGPGGGYDLYARTLARFMGRHIPGNPSVVPQNMPGAGSLKAANYIYSVAPKDGTQMATFSRGLVLDPLLGHSDGVRYDATKFSWLGSVSDEVAVCAFWYTAGIKTWADMQTKPYKIAGSGPGADSDVFPTVFKNIFHLPLKLVSGYPGGAEMNLGMQRREVDGRCGWSWSSLVSQNGDMLAKKQLTFPVQIAFTKHRDLPNVPLIMDLVSDPKQKAALRLIVSRQAMARPFALPPGVPAERMKILRDAFDATMKDPGFLAEMKRLQLEVAPVSGQALDALVKQGYATPKDVVAMASAATK